MKTLGIDYGKAKVGLAIGEGSLAEPMQVIRYTNIDILEQQIKQVIERENIDKVVVGVSEGEMGEESKKFAKKIGAITFDETLSTQDAQELSRQAGINRKKRKEMEDAYAASIMLQSYLDTNV
jgi:putative Holliday junction resolvase